MLIGLGNKDIKPVSPFTKNNQEIVHKEFIDYKTGKKVKGLEYWQNLSKIFFDYLNHPEHKLQGNIGVLERKHIISDNIIVIGKETRNIEQQNLQKQEINEYTSKKELIEKIKSLNRKQALALGLSKTTFYKIKNRIKQGKRIILYKKTLSKLS